MSDDEKKNDTIEKAVQHLLGTVKNAEWPQTVGATALDMYRIAQERHTLERQIKNAEREKESFELNLRNQTAHTAYFESLLATEEKRYERDDRQTVAMEKQAAAWESIAKSAARVVEMMERARTRR